MNPQQHRCHDDDVHSSGRRQRRRQQQQTTATTWCRLSTCRRVIFAVVIAVVSCTFYKSFSFFLQSSWNQERPNGHDDMASLTTHHHQQQQQQPHRLTLPPRQSSANKAGFVHIGKTGGSTISSWLKQGCNSLVQNCERQQDLQQSSPVSQWVEHYYHVPDFWRLPDSNHQSFIVSIRDPYDRTVSALLYHHPQNAAYYNLTQTLRQRQLGPIAYQCFPTLEAFASLLVPKHSNNDKEDGEDNCHYPYRHNVVEPKDCTALACSVLEGKVRFFTHLFFNYRNILYTKLPLPRKSRSESATSSSKRRQIYVIRQEHLLEDWQQLNAMVEAAGVVGEKSSAATKSHWKVTDVTSNNNTVVSHRNITGLQLPVTREISAKGRQKLCLALQMEYVAYFELLQLAVNMNGDDVQDCQRLAQQNCPNLDLKAVLDSIEKTKKGA